jgi:hypothetical protein
LQAKLLGKRLSTILFKEIYVSDLNRTVQTADSIKPFHEDTPIIYEKLIREKSAGIFEGQSIEKIKETAFMKNINIRKFRPENGENWEDVYKRALEFINSLLIKHVKSDYKDETFKKKNKSANISLKEEEQKKIFVEKYSNNNSIDIEKCKASEDIKINLQNIIPFICKKSLEKNCGNVNLMESEILQVK